MSDRKVEDISLVIRGAANMLWDEAAEAWDKARGDGNGIMLVSPLRLDKVNDDVTAHLAPADSRVAITASAQILAAPGKLRGFWIVSHTAGATVRFSDALTATTPYVSSAWTSEAAHKKGEYIMLSQNGMRMTTGCYVTITGTIEILVDAMTD